MWSGTLGNVTQSRVASNAHVKKVVLFLTESPEVITVPIVI